MSQGGEGYVIGYSVHGRFCSLPRMDPDKTKGFGTKQNHPNSYGSQGAECRTGKWVQPPFQDSTRVDSSTRVCLTVSLCKLNCNILSSSVLLCTVVYLARLANSRQACT